MNDSSPPCRWFVERIRTDALATIKPAPMKSMGPVSRFSLSSISVWEPRMRPREATTARMPMGRKVAKAMRQVANCRERAEAGEAQQGAQAGSHDRHRKGAASLADREGGGEYGIGVADHQRRPDARNCPERHDLPKALRYNYQSRTKGRGDDAEDVNATVSVPVAEPGPEECTTA